jgi:hypothetical protein
MSAHADASPSSAHQWIHCPASVTKARGRTRKATVYTREGTAAHHVAETLIHGLNPPDEVEVEGEVVEVDDDMVDYVERYVEYVEKLKRGADVFMTEVRVSLDGLPEPVFGTADVIAYWRKARAIEVPDLKYGKGVLVSPKDNPQVRIYALGAINALGPFEPVDMARMTIVQPRAQGSSVQSEDVSVEELLQWERDVLAPAAQRLADGDETENPGEHCRFCVRAGECKSIANLAQTSAKMVFKSKASTPDVGGFNNDELAAILDKAELISGWIAKVRAEASQRLDHGQTVQGWKLASKRAMRRWADEGGALAALTKSGLSHADVTKIVSPAAAERVLKRAGMKTAILDKLVVKESSGTTLVRDDDPRKGIAADAKSVFGGLSSVL